MPLFAEWLGVPLSEMVHMLSDLRPDMRMFRAVGELRRHGIRTCLLSNSWGTALYPRDLLAEVFDDVVISEEVGMRKPDQEIFRLAAQRIDLEPNDCVFIDDTFKNFEGASALGITNIHHVSVQTTLDQLQVLLGVDLSGVT